MHGRSLVPVSVLPQEQRPRKMISPQTDTSFHTRGRRSKGGALGLGARRHPGGQMAQYRSTFRGASASQVTVTAHMWSHHTHPDHHRAAARLQMEPAAPSTRIHQGPRLRSTKLDQNRALGLSFPRWHRVTAPAVRWRHVGLTSVWSCGWHDFCEAATCGHHLPRDTSPTPSRHSKGRDPILLQNISYFKYLLKHPAANRNAFLLGRPARLLCISTA